MSRLTDRSTEPMFPTGSEEGAPHAAQVVPGSRHRGGTRNQFREPPGTSGTIRFESLAAFMERADKAPPVDWLIPEMVPDSGSLLLVAPTNAGKTWLALAIIKAAADKDRPVFMVEEEGSLRGFAGRFRDLAIPAEAPISVSHLQGVRLDTPPTLQALCAKLREAARPPVLVLDALTYLSSYDENDTAEANRLVRAFAELRRANEAGLLVVLHHTNKAAGRGGSSINAARGSSVFSGWFDAQLNLQRQPTPKGSGRIAFSVEVAKMREAERGPSRLITLTRGTGEITMEEMRDESAELVSEVRAVLEGSERPLFKNEICKQVSGRKQDVLAAIAVIEPECERDPKGRLSLPKAAP